MDKWDFDTIYARSQDKWALRKGGLVDVTKVDILNIYHQVVNNTRQKLHAHFFEVDQFETFLLLITFESRFELLLKSLYCCVFFTIDALSVVLLVVNKFASTPA